MLRRLFEGQPVLVLLRLCVASLIVGFVMVWFDLRPLELVHISQRIMLHVWDMGFDALSEAAHYILAGAVVVVPVWLVSRLFSPRR